MPSTLSGLVCLDPRYDGLVLSPGSDLRQNPKSWLIVAGVSYDQSVLLRVVKRVYRIS